MILLCMAEELKKMEAALLSGISEIKKEDQPLRLFQRLSSETTKVVDAASRLDQTYESHLLEFKTVAEFLGFLGVSEDSVAQLLDLHKAAEEAPSVPAHEFAPGNN